MCLPRSILLLVLAAAVLAACAAPVAPSSPRPAPGLASSSPAALLLSAPIAPPDAPPLDVPADPVPASAATQAAWARPVARWIELGVNGVALSGMSPTRASRSLALLAIGMDAGLAAADAARKDGVAISDAGVLSGVAETILARTQAAGFDMANVARTADEAAWAGYHAGQDTREAVIGGRALGRAVGAAVLHSAADDGAAEMPRLGTFERDSEGRAVPAAPGVWWPTALDELPPADPLWGQVRPMVLAAGSDARIPPPPAWDSPAFAEVRAAFAETQRGITEADYQLAWRWDYRHGSSTPVGAWFSIARDLVERDGLDARQSAAVFAVLGVTLNDTLIAVWDSKYTYNVARPVHWMHESDPQWLPVLVDTPNHPSYPSGHAAISAASATVLSQLFPQDAAMLEQQAQDAARSRIVGGIHWQIDADAGMAQGRDVAGRVLHALDGAISPLPLHGPAAHPIHE